MLCVTNPCVTDRAVPPLDFGTGVFLASKTEGQRNQITESRCEPIAINGLVEEHLGELQFFEADLDQHPRLSSETAFVGKGAPGNVLERLVVEQNYDLEHPLDAVPSATARDTLRLSLVLKSASIPPHISGSPAQHDSSNWRLSWEGAGGDSSLGQRAASANLRAGRANKGILLSTWEAPLQAALASSAVWK